MQKLTCLWVLFMGHFFSPFKFMGRLELVILSGLKAHFTIGFLFCHIGFLAFVFFFFHIFG